MLRAGVKANVQSYSSVISAFARAGDVCGAERWLSSMEAAGIKGDTISYTAAINACARTGNAKKAEQWLIRMLEAGVEPNIITFNAVIAACAKAGKGKLCEQWMEKMRRAGVQPNSFTYNSAAKPYVTAGDYYRVEQIVDDMRRDRLQLDDFCLTSLIHAYSNAKPHKASRKRQQIEKVFREFVAEGVYISHTAMQALQRVLGRQDALALCKECGVDAQAQFTTRSGGGARMTVKKPVRLSPMCSWRPLQSELLHELR